MFRNAFLVAVLTVIGLAASTHDAYAYLDPGTASIVLQGIIGGIAAAAAVGAVYWRRVKNFFSKLVGRGGDDSLTAAKSRNE